MMIGDADSVNGSQSQRSKQRDSSRTIKGI
jgi:hypothetical protein